MKIAELIIKTIGFVILLHFYGWLISVGILFWATALQILAIEEARKYYSNIKE